MRALSVDDVGRMVGVSFGPAVTCADASPLTGGGYAAVWSVTLSDGRRVVLKAGPPADVPVLTYEADLVAAEADYFRLARRTAPSVPVPDVLDVGADATGQWLFTSRLDGIPLARALEEAPRLDDRAARRDLGAALALVHGGTGDFFGYSGDRPSGGDWPSAFGAIVEAVLEDAGRWGVALGPVAGQIRDVLARSGDALAAVDRAHLLHFDVWDGNVLVAADESGTWRLTGLVDGERWLYGDPLVDFVSAALFRRMEETPDHPFVAGYREAAGCDPLAAPMAALRLSLYRMFLYLLMLVELPSRGRGATAGDGDRAFLQNLLESELSYLQTVDGGGRGSATAGR